MTVYLGAEGTDDNVRMKVCSTDLKTCCVSDKLSHLLSSEWVKEKQEKWDAGDFGKKCKNQVFKVFYSIKIRASFFDVKCVENFLLN